MMPKINPTNSYINDSSSFEILVKTPKKVMALPKMRA